MVEDDEENDADGAQAVDQGVGTAKYFSSDKEGVAEDKQNNTPHGTNSTGLPGHTHGTNSAALADEQGRTRCLHTFLPSPSVAYIPPSHHF